ncbi:MAG: cysteine desulfurase NifS [Acidobacteriota bacterium]|nr:cysteine desulfurase NifS [Acidobacteriota bacterium]MDQ7088154.1 cysteine desulfurase NifS [Acidobacteriota bacterium]
MEIIYADNNATTRVAPEVLEALLPYLRDDYFNPSSMYEAARSAAAAVDAARRSVARSLGGVAPREILFTSCATESNNTAILGCAKARPERRHIITTRVEHPAVLTVCQALEREGYELSWIGVDRDGRIDLDAYVRALRPDTLLVSVMHANNETGVIFPIERLSRLAKETDPEILFHTDATQTAGKLPLDLKRALPHVDLLSFSGHKIHAPKGVGALFIRRGTPCRALLLGGHQEEGRRGGTENVAFVVGLARALEVAVAGHAEDDGRITALRDRLESALLARIPFARVNGAGAERLGNTSNLSCHFIEGEGMLYQLSAHGICASSGSACTSGSLEPSHVLRAMDVPFTAMHGSVRFSFSRYNSERDVERIVEVFPGIVASLRRLSPYWDQQADRPRPDAMAMLEPGGAASAP